MPAGPRTQFQGGSLYRGRCRPDGRLDLRSREDQHCNETASENPGPRVSQRDRRIGESDDRKHGRMVLEEIRIAMSRPLRDCRARDTYRALHLSRRMKDKLSLRRVRETKI